MKLLFSIIIPIYNTEKYLTQCLESVINQTYQFDEIILINDGSTDQSIEICRTYMSKYNTIKIINQSNAGLSVARNRGLEAAKGDYILFLDSDDWIDLNLLYIIKKYLQNEKLDAIFFDAKIFRDNEQDKITKNIYDRSKAGLDYEGMKGMDYLKKIFPCNYVTSSCMAVVKKSILKNRNIKFPEGIYYEDNLFMFMLLKEAELVRHISNKLYCRRYRLGSIMTSIYSERKFGDFIKCVNLIWDEILRTNHTVLEEYEDLFLALIVEYCDFIFGKYNICKNNHIFLHKETIEILNETLEKFLRVVDFVYKDYIKTKLSTLNRISYNINRIRDFITNIDDNIIQRIYYAQKMSYIELLRKIPLNKKQIKIGIYGTGKHTEGLIAIYETLIEKINCKLYFIDSYRDNGIYKDKPLINYKKIDDSFDLIIISSFLYQKDMTDYIREINLSIPIINFYDTYEIDVFSEYQQFIKMRKAIENT